MTQIAVNHSLVLQPASAKKQESGASPSLPAKLASALFGPKSGPVPKLDDYTIEPIAVGPKSGSTPKLDDYTIEPIGGDDFVDSNPFAVEEEIDWSRRNDPAARLEGDLRAMPRNITERIKNVEKVLGKALGTNVPTFPKIVLVDTVPGAHFEPKTNELQINKNLSHNKQLSLMIFELLNIERLDEFDYACEEARNGFHTMKSFGEAYEKIEFENTLTHHRLVQGLPREFDIYRNPPWNSFEEYLQMATEHTQMIHQRYLDSGFKYLYGPDQTTPAALPST